MLRTFAIAIIPILLAATPSAAVTSQEKMETCKVGAESQQLQGAKRSAFIKKCMARLDKDIASPEVKATLQESFKLAESLGLNGTPSYVIGDNVVVGAVGLEALKEKVNTSRCGKPSC